MYAFSHSSVSYALYRYALYTVVTHVSYANSVTRFIRLPLRSYAFYTEPILIRNTTISALGQFKTSYLLILTKIQKLFCTVLLLETLVLRLLC